MRSRSGHLICSVLLVLALLVLCSCAPGGPQESASTSATENSSAVVEEAEETSALPELPEGVVPVTWEVSPEHLMIQTDEARALYERIVANDYPTMEELKAHPVVAQLDALAAYYKAYYGKTSEINTPEREQLRKEVIDEFLSLGSARTESVDENGKHHYVYKAL